MLSFVYIFFIRIIESILNTYRTILTINKNKILILLISFFEILVWLIAVKTIITRNFDIFSTIAYALGFSLGNCIGIMLNNLFNKRRIFLKISNVKNIDKLKKIIKDYEFEIYKIKSGKNIIIINIYENELNTIKQKLNELQEKVIIDIISYKRV